MLVLASHVPQCGIHVCAEQQSWLPAGEAGAPGPSFTMSAFLGTGSKMLA